MLKSTDLWFRHLKNERTLTEGLRDIGLPEFVVDYIEDAMPDAPEKSKMLMGNLWKQDKFSGNEVKTRQFNIVNFMVSEFDDYIQARNIGGGVKGDLTVRTVEPFDINKGTNAPRIPYDDERIEQGKRVKFVIQNLKNGLAKPFGTWRKAFMKAVRALSKTGIPSERVETVKEILQAEIRGSFRMWWNRYDLIAVFLNDDPTNYELAKKTLSDSSGEFDSDDLHSLAVNYLENKENPENVLHQFDDGSYWYNLDTSNCSVEAERMGHCGSDHRGTLVSLRKKKKDRRESSSYVTMTWGGDVLYQIKGRNNDAPPDETWDHIAWFINNFDIDTVEETGEHSSDYDGFEMMNDYLSSNTDARFSGNIEEIIEQIQESVDNIYDRFNDNRNELGVSEIGCEVESGEEFGGNPRTIYLSMDCSMEMQIDLGWPGFTTRDGMYRPTTGPDSTEPLELEDIPINTYGAESREFENEVGFDDIVDLPGEDLEISWEVKMLTGVQPGEYDPDPDARPLPTAHLIVEFRNRLMEYTDPDGPVTAVEFDEFADSVLEVDENYAGLQEQVRRALVEGEYANPNTYDRAITDLTKMDQELDNFVIIETSTGIKFLFQPTTNGAERVESSQIKSNISISSKIKQYVADNNASYNRPIETLFGAMFGSTYGMDAPSTRLPIETQKINDQMATNIRSIYAQRESPSDRQATFDFGAGYEASEPELILAKDTKLLIFPKTGYQRGSRSSYPDMTFNWSLVMEVNTRSDPEEFKIIQTVVSYLDKNPDIVFQAADQIFENALRPLTDRADKAISFVNSEQEFLKVYNRIDSIYGARASGPDFEETPRRIMMIVSWFRQNWGQLSQVQRFIMWKYFLQPMSAGSFAALGVYGEIETDGKPTRFNQLVRDQLSKLGATSSQQSSGTEVRESMEEQIDRIESLINEVDPSYDLRIYNIQVGCTVSKDVGGTESETATEIRGIPGVTTVRPVAAKKRDVTPTAEYVLYDIKFELLGAKSRVEYRDEILLPGMRRIRGLKLLTVSSMHRTNRQGTIRTVRESKVMNEYGYEGSIGGFGGIAGNLGAQRSNITKKRPTPRQTIQRMLDDWSEGGVMAYDAPTDSTNMRYHVMMPVEELLPFTNRTYRGDKRDFDGRYKYFIRTGPQNPVYLALGQNRRAKVTGGEDLIWFAKKSGLKELPVFLSFQKQV